MASMKRGAVVASTLMLIAVIASACNQPYSTPPVSNVTPNLFTTGTAQITMSDIASFGTQTAIASQVGTPQVQAMATQTPGPGVTPQDTPTPQVSTNPAFTATTNLAVIGTVNNTAVNNTASGPVSTSAPVGSRPPQWTLHKGEFPYCIARRFDVDPGQLLSLNGLSNGEIYYPNLTLKIPQTGSFPGTRALAAHPATYTVTSGETLYSIACRYGDLNPVDIANLNGLSSPDAPLAAGTVLKFP